MTRKHFIAIADAVWVSAQSLNLNPKDHESLAKEMASTVGQFNSNFDRDRFVDRCMTGWK